MKKFWRPAGPEKGRREVFQRFHVSDVKLWNSLVAAMW
jgi:hypothetical protein